MKKLQKSEKIVLAGKIMRVGGALGILTFLVWGIYLIVQKGGADYLLVILGVIVVLSFLLLVVGDFLIRLGGRKGIEAQIRRRSDEK